MQPAINLMDVVDLCPYKFPQHKPPKAFKSISFNTYPNKKIKELKGNNCD